MISTADKAFYAAQVQNALDTLNAKFNTSVKMPAIKWDLRGKSRLGTASGWQTIHLNLQFAAALGPDKYIQTVLHETCHIVTSWRREMVYGEPHQKSGPFSSHGAEWQRAMRVLGRAPERCSSNSAEVMHLIKPARRVTKFQMTCGCPQGHLVTAVIKNKVLRGARYTCKRCHKAIGVA